MDGSFARLPHSARIVGWALVGAVSVCPQTFAQPPTDPAVGTQVDRAANPQALAPIRSSFGLFQNDVQRNALQGYHTTTRDFANAGLGTDTTRGFGLTWRGGGGSAPGPSTTGLTQSVRPLQFGFSSPNRGLQKGYGGFRPRRLTFEPGDLRGTLGRRYDVLNATAQNSPLYGALARTQGTMVPQRWSSPRAFVRSGASSDETSQSSLAEHLQANVAYGYATARAEGWSWFKAGSYRRAIRSFESARAIHDGDAESRIGELFSHAMLGQYRTAYVLLEGLLRRDVNPFAHDLNLRDRAGSSEATDALQTHILVHIQSRNQDRSLAALHAFVLWYLGEKDEARRVATNLAREPGGTAFAEWPRLMAAAEQGASSEP